MTTSHLPAVRRTDGAGGRMTARAVVHTELRQDAAAWHSTRLAALRSQAPLKLFQTLPKEPEPWAGRAGRAARVAVAAGAAGPVGGDRLRLEAEVGPGSMLVLTEVSATLLLPGHDGARSCTEFRIRVGDGATLVWLPEPVVAAAGCAHTNDVRVELGRGSRLLMREETLLGRHGERPGRARQAVRVRQAGRAVYEQELELGTATGDAPAVAGAHRAVGTVLVVDPELGRTPRRSMVLGGDASLVPLADDAALVSVLCGDNLTLRRRLGAGLAALGPPWDPRRAAEG